MSDYSPCASCNRHVKGDECPFCGAAVDRREPVATFGRMSRAMVFASATLAAAACGGPKKQATAVPSDEAGAKQNKQMQHRHRPCIRPDPAKAAEAQKKIDEAKTDEEKQAAEKELALARQTVCAPYGAPPARRRVV